MMKRNLVIILILSILASGIAGKTDAQFWKKKSDRQLPGNHLHDGDDAQSDERGQEPVKQSKRAKREQKRKEKKERKRQKREQKKQKKTSKKGKGKYWSEGVTEAGMPAQSPRRGRDGGNQNARARYRIDVLAPLYLDELEKAKAGGKNKIPQQAQQGVAYYEGIMIAADSMKRAGFNLDIYIHDVASAKESVEKLIASGKMDSTDLIIGAVQPQDVATVAGYAKQRSVNFISTLSVFDGGVKDNKFFTLFQPSLRSHCEWIMNELAEKYDNQRISILYRTSTVPDDNAYKYISKAPSRKLRFRYLACNTMPRKENFDLVVEPGKPNILVVSILDIGFADSLITELSHDYPTTHFEIYGMPSWSGIDDIRNKHSLANLSINITGSFSLDKASPVSQYIRQEYKNNYGTKVPELAYRGYETMFWYAGLLKRYGPRFNDNYGSYTTGPFSKIEIKPEYDYFNAFQYYENKRIFLTTYEKEDSKED